MKEIKAIIQPFTLSKVVRALKEINGLPGLTADTSVRGFGRGRAEGSSNRIVDDLIEYVPKVKLEIVVPDSLVETVVSVIQEHAHTGSPGDGKIFIYDIQEVVRIRTGQRGEAAI